MLTRHHLNPSISCVIPAYNEARSLGAVIAEILATLGRLSTHVELIVVDDGSRDNTAEIMQGLCAMHP